MEDDDKNSASSIDDVPESYVEKLPAGSEEVAVNLPVEDHDAKEELDKDDDKDSLEGVRVEIDNTNDGGDQGTDIDNDGVDDQGTDIDNDEVDDQGTDTDDDDATTANSVVSGENLSLSTPENVVETTPEVTTNKRGRKRRGPWNVSRKGRTPSVKGLSIPFRTVKKAMKLDPDTPIVQNEAAIMTTFAVELFLQKLTRDSYEIAKEHGRNTVRYEDVAEARTHRTRLDFLEMLLP